MKAYKPSVTAQVDYKIPFVSAYLTLFSTTTRKPNKKSYEAAACGEDRAVSTLMHRYTVKASALSVTPYLDALNGLFGPSSHKL